MPPIRALARMAHGIIFLLFCLAGYGLTRPFGLHHIWPRFFLRHLGHAMGLRVSASGQPVPRGVLHVANHVSWLDILALGGATGAVFVSKDDVDGWPLVGWLARVGGTIFIDRESRRAARGQADRIGEALSRGQPIVLFPEGTTNDGRGLFPFRPALFASVAPAPGNVVVQPVAVDYGAAAADISWSGDDALGPNVIKVLARRGGLKVHLHFLPPLAPSVDRKAMAAEAQAAIERALAPSA